MRIGIGEPSKGMPNIGTEVLIDALKGDTWVSLKPDGRVAERIATGWAWDATGTVLRLKLRDDVYFHDGTRLTPELAADAFRGINFSNEGSSLGSIESVQAEGNDTIAFKLKERDSFLLADLGGMTVSKQGNPDIGTGPYQIAKREALDGSLTAFPRYYRGQPALAGIDIKNFPTQRNAWTALMRGEIDMLYEVSRDSSEFVQAETTVKTYLFPRPYYISLVFNMRDPILRHVAVRQAINEALDRDALVRDGLRGQGAPADGPVSPQHWAYSAPAERFAFDPASAARRLDAAGFPLKPNAERRVPVRFSFTCLVFGNDSRFDRLTLIAQKELADVGIDMRLEAVPVEKLVPRLMAGNFDAFLFERSGRSLSRVYDFWRSRERMANNSGYRSADAVLDRMRAAQTEEETRAAVTELLRVMHDDPPAAFIAWQRTGRAISAQFDVAAEPDRYMLPSLLTWRPVEANGQGTR